MERVCAILTTSKLLPARSDNHREGKAWVKTKPATVKDMDRIGRRSACLAWPSQNDSHFSISGMANVSTHIIGACQSPHSAR
jgi:hypothetical protein